MTALRSRAENINPAILAWARESAGLSVQDAARKIGLADSSRRTAAEKMASLERGDAKPTYKQLFQLAAACRRPLTVFYMSEPPPDEALGVDFRTLSDPISPEEDARLNTLLRKTHVRHMLARAVLEADEDAPRPAFVGSLGTGDPIRAAAQRIREALGFGDRPTFAKDYSSKNQLFEELRARTEQLGVFVVLESNLGSHHTGISPEGFRGFAIADEIAPFIVINDQDAQAARSFTLLHELAHVFANASGISASPSATASRTSSARTERFCNEVATEVLLPQNALASIKEVRRTNAQEVIRKTSDRWNLSRTMVAYRFWRTGRITAEDFEGLRADYAKRWKEQRARARANRKNGKGPDYYTVRRQHLGRALLNLATYALRSGELTHIKTAQLLGVKPQHLESLLNK